MSLQQFLAQYWGLISCFLSGIFYATLHYKTALSIAKKVALSKMLYIEKKAEDYTITQGSDKLKWVVEEGYNLLPSPVRLVVSKPMFQMLAQSVFDSVIGLAKDKQQVNTPVNPAPVTPVQNQPEPQPTTPTA